MENHTFDPAILANAVSGALGMRDQVVIEEAQTFSMSPNRMTIPNWAMPVEMIDVLRGGICHEQVGHARQTPIYEYAEWRKKAPELAQRFLGIIEDIRVERGAPKFYPGARSILAKMTGKLDSLAFFDPPEDLNPAGVLRCALLRTLRAEELGQPICAREITKIANEKLGAGVRAQAIAIAKKACRGTPTDCIAGAEALYALMKDVSEGKVPPPPPPTPDEKKGQESGQQQQAQAGEQQQSGDQSKGDQQQAGGGQEQSGSASDDAAKQAAQKIMKSTDQEFGPSDLADVINAAIQDSNGGGICQPSVKPINFRTLGDSVGNFDPNSDAVSTAIRVQSKLQEYLQSKVEDEDDSLTDYGRLSGSRLGAAMMGCRDVFTVDGDEGEGLNTSVMMLIDQSSSMSGPKADSALAATYALSTSMGMYEQQGVRFAVSMFNSSGAMLKEFSEPWVSVKNRLQFYRASGGTNFTEALKGALPRLLDEKKERKVLFIITDGDVGRLDANRAIVRSASEYGIEVRVLEISHNPIPNMADHGFISCGAVEPGSDLVHGIFKTLHSIL